MTRAGPGDQGPYLFALVDGGGVAVNLDTGGWSSLNASAAAICEAFQRRRSWDDARSMLVTRWGLGSVEADRAVETVRLALDQQAPPLFEEDVPYRRKDDHYILYHREQPILGVDEGARTIRILAPPARRRASLGHYLRLVSPKILAAHGHLVLHAAACRFGQRLVALIGASGAGKTTTSNLLAACGVPKVADDMLVVGLDASDQAILACPAAEERIYAWCDEAASQAADATTAEISTDGLLQAIPGPTLAMERLILLSGQRWPIDTFSTRPLGAAEALEKLMANGFLGSTDPGRLASYLEAHRAVSQRLPVEMAIVPEGMDQLRSALSRYMVNRAS